MFLETIIITKAFIFTLIMNFQGIKCSNRIQLLFSENSGQKKEFLLYFKNNCQERIFQMGKHLKKKQLLFISFMLFSMFFGAGNLIFPAFLGRASGTELWYSMGGFILSAVGLPILGVWTVAKLGSFNTLANRVHPMFALVFPFLIYISIGPGLAIPRAGTVAFEMGLKPFLPSQVNETFSLVAYSIVFFSLVLWLSLSPSKLVDRFGKLLTPTLLALIAIIFVKSLITPIGSFSRPMQPYNEATFFKGFLDGYLTMDLLASLVFGIVVARTIRSQGVEDSQLLSKYMMIAGLGAGILLATIYSILGYLGASSGNVGEADNGAAVLTIVMSELFGSIGIGILGILFTIACLCVSIGLVISCSQYFSSIIKMMSYKQWAITITLVSGLIANLGLNKILTISVPILGMIYPLAVVLIFIGLFDHQIKGNKAVYFFGILFTAVFSVIETINKSLLSGQWDSILKTIPFYSLGVGWILPALIGIMIGLSITFTGRKRRLSNKPQTAR
jgi:LIVCS family branched-chain amino acid:cation transporter